MTRRWSGGQRVQRAADRAGLLAARRLDVGALARLEALLDALVAGAGAFVDEVRRSASIARLWTMPSTHVRTEPRARS